MDKYRKCNFFCVHCARTIDMELPALSYGSLIKDGALLMDECDICKCLGDLLFGGNDKVAHGAAYILGERRKPVKKDAWSDYRI